MGQGEAHLGLFGDSVNLGTRKVLDLRRTDHRLINHFGHTRWYSFMMWVKWKLIWVHLEIVLVSTQERFSVCTECTKGTEIFLGAPDGASR